MRALLTTTPGKGSLEPLLSLASAMGDAGHRVAIASSSTLREDVERRGYEFIAAGLDWHTSDEQSLDILRAAGAITHPTRLTGQERSRWIVTELFIKVAARRMMRDLAGILPAWQPHIVIRESLEFSGCVAAELAGIPHASVAADSECALDQRYLLGDPLNGVRRDAGLMPDPDCVMPYRYLHACLMPPEFYGPAAVLAPNIVFCRATAADRTSEQVVDWEDGCGTAPRVLVSFGTVFHRTAGVYAAVLRALADEGVQALVASGYDSDPQDLASAVSGHISIETWLPLRHLLRGADIYITHGGFNSVREAIAAGVPLVVIPLGAGQFYVAERVSELGLGVAVPPGERTPKRIRDAVAALTNDDSYRRRARWLRQRMTALPAMTHTVQLIEQLVDGHSCRPLAHGGL
jgi:UDP:flavonoid glycosyltransferase YjiC (YdhE family)